MPRAFLSGAADLPERGKQVTGPPLLGANPNPNPTPKPQPSPQPSPNPKQDFIFWAGDEGTAAHTHYDPTHTVFVQVARVS